LQYLTPSLKEFILHNYVYRWQDLQFQECLENLAHDIVLFVLIYLRITLWIFKMKFKLCIGIIFKWVFWCTFPIDITLHLTLLMHSLPSSKKSTISFLMTQAMTLCMPNMHLCFIATIYGVQGAMWAITLFGYKVVQVN